MNKPFKELNSVEQDSAVCSVVEVFRDLDSLKSGASNYVGWLDDLIVDEHDLFVVVTTLLAADWVLADRFLSIYLTENARLFGLALKVIENRFESIELTREWVEVVWRLRCADVIVSAREKMLNKDDILPDYLKFSDCLCEYVLAWAYEEEKLTPHAEEYFSVAFEGKFRMLRSMRERDL